MSRTGTVTILLGIVVLVLGLIIIAGYYDARGQAEAANGFGGLSIMLQWFTNSFQLLILNLLLTGLALVSAGVGLRRLSQLQDSVNTRTTHTSREGEAHEGI